MTIPTALAYAAAVYGVIGVVIGVAYINDEAYAIVYEAKRDNRPPLVMIVLQFLFVMTVWLPAVLTVVGEAVVEAVREQRAERVRSKINAAKAQQVRERIREKQKEGSDHAE